MSPTAAVTRSRDRWSRTPSQRSLLFLSRRSSPQYPYPHCWQARCPCGIVLLPVDPSLLFWKGSQRGLSIVMDPSPYFILVPCRSFSTLPRVAADVPLLATVRSPGLSFRSLNWPVIRHSTALNPAVFLFFLASSVSRCNCRCTPALLSLYRASITSPRQAHPESPPLTLYNEIRVETGNMLPSSRGHRAARPRQASPGSLQPVPRGRILG
ncbi:hypothetical protein VTN02DRAFT_3478 [Thermoascus thermophilus]